MTGARLIAAAATLVALLAAVSGCGSADGAGPTARKAPATASKTTATAPPFRFFSPRSPWNRPLPADTATDPSSAPIVATLTEEVGREVAAKTGPWINTTSYSVPIVRVPLDQPTVRVRLDAPYAAPALRAAFAAVPLPADVSPSPGNDAHLVLYQPGTDRLWEFWHLARAAGGWTAAWGGAFDHVSAASGVYGPGAWPGATPLWGASASSLSIAGGLITLEDLNRGVINHALSMSLPQIRAGVYASPARRTDGKSQDPMVLPEGAHLRLPAHLDLARLHLRPPTLMLARAARRYGIFVRDGAHNVAFNAQPPRSPARDHYRGPHGYFEGLSPRELLASFPWGSLQLLPMRLHSFARGHDPIAEGGTG